MKKWIDLDAQVQRHIDRGLQLGTTSRRQFALFLYSSNYYRVSGYGRCFYDAGSDTYKAGTSAGQLMDIYDHDRAVRNMVLDGIGVVEPTLRSRVAYHVAQVLGADDGYLCEDFYLPSTPEPDGQDANALSRWSAEVRNRDLVLSSFRELRDRDEIFIRHHIQKGDPVPFWAIIEVVSMGTFSRFLRALRDKRLLLPVTKSLNLEDERKFLQAVQNLAFLRNIAAHHGRIWNRRLDGHVTLPQLALSVKRDYLAPKTPAAALTLLAGLVDQIEGGNSYSSSLLDLVHESDGYAIGCYKPIL
ncbi:Abi family protein [Glutamicibacter halophytocola]|uniref:Abi family protein n=1 Tax=Glutamicibacter halophytocola TaxID=1933880 RepID=A0AA95BS63_9MICC|nr:Abi family protein [Glutamicibacter halophytocola]UUX59879.1 Abi family protein [Glutamicibacter halophytocola]